MSSNAYARRRFAPISVSIIVLALLTSGIARANIVVYDIPDETTKANFSGGNFDGTGVWFTVPTGVVDNRNDPSFPNPLFEDGKFLLIWHTAFVQPEAEIWVQGFFSNGNDVMADNTGNARQYAAGGLISAADDLGVIFTDLGPTFGNWELGDHGYLGLVFPIAGQLHYGWAEITINPSASITLHAFGYNDVANQSILAGEVPEPASAIGVSLAGMGLMCARRNRRGC